MSNTQKISMSRFIFQYLIPLFTAALVLVLLSYLSDIRAQESSRTAADTHCAVSAAHAEPALPETFA